MEISAYRNIPHYASAKPSYRHYSSYYFLMRRTSRIPLLQPLAPSSGTAFILRIVQAKPSFLTYKPHSLPSTQCTHPRNHTSSLLTPTISPAPITPSPSFNTPAFLKTPTAPSTTPFSTPLVPLANRTVCNHSFASPTL